MNACIVITPGTGGLARAQQQTKGQTRKNQIGTKTSQMTAITALRRYECVRDRFRTKNFSNQTHRSIISCYRNRTLRCKLSIYWKLLRFDSICCPSSALLGLCSNFRCSAERRNVKMATHSQSHTLVPGPECVRMQRLKIIFKRRLTIVWMCSRSCHSFASSSAQAATLRCFTGKCARCTNCFASVCELQ